MSPRYRTLTALALALGGTVFAVVPALSAGATTTTTTTTPADKTLDASLKSATKETSVVWRTVTVVGTAKLSELTYAGVDDGLQQVTLTTGGKTGHATEKLVGKSVYLEGDVNALSTFMGFKAASAKSEAGKWMVIQSSSDLFDGVSTGLTVQTTVGELGLASGTKVGTAKRYNGTNVITYVGKTVADSSTPAVSATIYTNAAGSHLPVAEIEVNGKDTATVDFSNWDKPFSVTAPKGAIKFDESWLSS